MKNRKGRTYIKKYGKIWSILDGTFHWAQTLKLGGMNIVIGTSFIKRSCGVYFHVTFRIWHGLLNIKGTTRTSSYVVYLPTWKKNSW